MVQFLEVVSVLIVAVAMALSLAHALELPGKMRLSEREYLSVQPIYYPGFTYGGISEPLGIVALLILAFLQDGAARFWFTSGAAVLLAGSHLAYWLLTHPVNNFWLKDAPPRGAGGKFFASDPLGREKTDDNAAWMALRDRWERSHLLRAALTFASLTLVTIAAAI